MFKLAALDRKLAESLYRLNVFMVRHYVTLPNSRRQAFACQL